MTSEKESFDPSGPLHLSCVDWNNEDHRRSVAACLVQGVYNLERDRQENRQGPQALAPPWWEFAGFKLDEKLIDVDLSIFGAIYEFTSPSCSEGTPRCIIAFRGTLTKGDARLLDFEVDLDIIRNRLHRTPRFQNAMQTVRNKVAAYGNSNVWLTGHSLGAAIAMLVGKSMAKTNVFLEAFLFNPPFVSAPIEIIKNKNVKHGIRIGKSLITAGVTVAVKARRGHHQQMDGKEDPFVALKKMEDIGAGCVERLATQNSLGGLVMSAMGKESEEPLHLIPSANLIVNLVPAKGFKQAHGIHQWWARDPKLQSTEYNYW
ncbi:hypothetical protein Vadar_032940 [Vaccinium darrowii]|uniref:Uncharacterized protein n=1 Tax=Vaccinium darrowii TaxID=229202 RepID=A0ACB7ZG19_9ERIC|nr:hypothetical protein Vadar_032940 [Vaccinium darrowii]